MGNSDSSQGGYQHHDGNNAQDSYEQGILEEMDIEEADRKQREKEEREAKKNTPPPSKRGQGNMISPEGGGNKT